MSGGAIETHLDDEPFATGTHKGPDASATLICRGADFRSGGVQTGVLIKNTTDGSSGLITARDENTVTATLTGGTDNAWDYGDTYEIYLTATEDSEISSIWTDKRYGRKADREKLSSGLMPEDEDLDEYDNPHVFGPGQPEGR